MEATRSIVKPEDETPGSPLPLNILPGCSSTSRGTVTVKCQFSSFFVFLSFLVSIYLVPKLVGEFPRLCGIDKEHKPRNKCK